MATEHTLSLFDATAERIAYDEAMKGEGRPLSQVRTELVYGTLDHTVQTCTCGATFFAAPRADSTCNLCRKRPA